MQSMMCAIIRTHNGLKIIFVLRMQLPLIIMLGCSYALNTYGERFREVSKFSWIYFVESVYHVVSFHGCLLCFLCNILGFACSTDPFATNFTTIIIIIIIISSSSSSNSSSSNNNSITIIIIIITTIIKSEVSTFPIFFIFRGCMSVVAVLPYSVSCFL